MEPLILKGTQIRYVLSGGERWYVLRDIAEHLNYSCTMSKFYIRHIGKIRTNKFSITGGGGAHDTVCADLPSVLYLFTRSRMSTSELSDIIQRRGRREEKFLEDIQAMFPMAVKRDGGLHFPRYNIFVNCHECPETEKINQTLSDPTWINHNPEEQPSIVPTVAAITTWMYECKN